MTTAYILIYMRTKEFNNMQSITLSIPERLQRLSGSHLASTNGMADDVVVVLADDLLRIELRDIQSQSLQLRAEGDTQSQGITAVAALQYYAALRKGSRGDLMAGVIDHQTRV